MGQFSPGESKTARVVIRNPKPKATDYTGLLYLGTDLAVMAEAPFRLGAVNKDTGEIAESFTPYTSSGRALRGGKAYATRHWKGDKALVEVWRQPQRYSENLKIQPVVSETIPGTKPAAVIPTEPRQRRRRGRPGELEFLPDSPEFLAYTIEDIGYRDKIDNAFLQAIAQARRD